MTRSRALAIMLLGLGAFAVPVPSAWASAGNAPAPGIAPLLPTRIELKRAFSTTRLRPWRFKPGTTETVRSIATTRAAAWDMRRIESLVVRAKLARINLLGVRLRWALASRLGGEYAAAHPIRVPTAGKGAEVTLQLAAEAGALVPVGHQRPWDEMSAAEVLKIELRAETSGDTESRIDIKLWEPELKLAETDAKQMEAQLLGLDLSVPPPDIDAEATLSFRIDPMPSDPFASVGQGDVRIRLPNGREVLAFLDQSYVVHADGPAGRVVPCDASRYRVYLPPPAMAGNFTVRSGDRSWMVSAVAMAELREGMAARAHARTSAQRGGVKTSRWKVPQERPVNEAKDPIFEGLWSGAPRFWRLTLSEPMNWEVTEPLRATTYWRPVLFWNPRWGAFGGHRRVDFSLAKRMDALLAEAHKKGLARPLCVLDHEWFSRHGQFNWLSHPLNVSQGGVFTGPGEVFRSEEGIAYCRRVMRYSVARWGRSRAVSSFLVTVSLNTPSAPDLHARLAAIARRCPSIKDGDKPLISLHPMALEPRMVKEVGRIGAGGQVEGGTWYAGEPQPSRLRIVPRVKGRWELGAAVDLEIKALRRQGSVCAIKPFQLAAVDYRSPADDDFHTADALIFDVWLPPGAPADLRAGIHLRDRDNLWFQALLPGLLSPGDWSTCVVDLTGANAHGLKPVDHGKAWTKYSRGRIREIGLHVYTTHPDRRLVARFARVRAVSFDRLSEVPKRKLTLLTRPPRTVTRGGRWDCHLLINHTYANPFDLREVDLVAAIRRPNGKVVRVPAFFDQPCRRREASKGGREIVDPFGAERWTVRYRVQDEGAHFVTFELRERGRYRIVDRQWAWDRRFSPKGDPYQPLIRDPKEEWVFRYRQYSMNGRRLVENLRYEPGPVVAKLALEAPAFIGKRNLQPWKGFVRTDKDRRHLRYDDGSFYYALGPCLRSPSDNRLPYKNPKWNEAHLNRIADRGTYQYDDYLASFQEAGINWTRIWMCSWWCGLQWRRDWPGYQGLGRFNLLNAWRLDHVLDECERRGVHVSLCLNNHGQVSRVIDTEWVHNPYNKRFGGPLASANEFFTRAQARIPHMNYLRYVAARWGHSPAIMTWELFSELEFTEEYLPSLQVGRGRKDRPAPNIEAWHTAMAEWLKTCDPNRHLVATHYSHPIRGAGTFHLPDVELAMSNAYSAFEELARGRNDAPAALSEFWKGSSWNGGVFKGMRVYGKPVLVEEQGRHWMGVEEDRFGRPKVNNTRDQLDADLHAGLWGSMVQPLAGATGYWWWLHVHFDNRYGEYRALSRFMAGEDLRPDERRREPDLEPRVVPVFVPNAMLRARALASDRRAYVWVYHRSAPHKTTGFPVTAGAVLRLPTIRHGRYSIEFWDTTAGRRVSRTTVSVPTRRGPRQLEFSLPAFRRDVAVKVKEAGR